MMSNTETGTRLSSIRILFSLYFINTLIELHHNYFPSLFFASHFKISYPFLNPLLDRLFISFELIHANGLFWGMLVGTLFVLFGVLYRLSALVVVLSYGFLFFSLKSYYNDGSYLMLITWIVLLFLDSNCFYNVGNYLFKRKLRNPHKNELNLVRYLVIAIVLVSGLNKMNSIDWISRAEPLRTVFFTGSSSYPYPTFVQLHLLLNPEQLNIISSALSYFILGSELISPALLLSEIPLIRGIGLLSLDLSSILMAAGFPKVRTFYTILLILLNSLWVNINFLKIFLNWFTMSFFFRNNDNQQPEQSGKSIRQVILLLLVLSQVAVPVYFYTTSTEDSDWTREGAFFTWKESTFIEHELTRVEVSISEAGEERRVMFIPSQKDRKLRLNERQYEIIKNDPASLIQYIEKYLKPGFRALEIPIEGIYVDSWRSFNGRPYQRWIDPSINFLDVSYDPMKGHTDWLLPSIEEVNTKTWLDSLDIKRDQWADQRAEIFYFADMPGQEYQALVSQNAIFFGFVLLQGNAIIEIQNQEPRIIGAGEYTELDFDTWFTVRTVGDTPSCWGFTFTYPTTQPFLNSLNIAEIYEIKKN
eukprot:TRINITY_DN9690_c0_g1_i1.p1 TRINITY_DN9690_c0_g1~~TRINITY_DN9690_c0_g1_i1.p1  ORF type:complete len:588 (-),score=93.45 TRINITY_DN9690_c0_g1_i1:58-1821(-)